MVGCGARALLECGDVLPRSTGSKVAAQPEILGHIKREVRSRSRAETLLVHVNNYLNACPGLMIRTDLSRRIDRNTEEHIDVQDSTTPRE